MGGCCSTRQVEGSWALGKVLDDGREQDLGGGSVSLLKVNSSSYGEDGDGSTFCHGQTRSKNWDKGDCIRGNCSSCVFISKMCLTLYQYC